MGKEYTIIVNSCDAYEDLWFPFFTLLKKYWNPLNVRVILNTETKVYHMDGLSIECIHPKKRNASYGERMLHVLNEIDTPYVIPLLDDFFLRKPVDHAMIEQIIEWMNNDKSIVYFNCDDTPVYEEWEREKYPGFHRIPRGNEYTLNMQAAVWRTEKLISYWKPDVSPWEWEVFCNLTAARKWNEKFYCVSKYGAGFCDYGYKLNGMGVYRGKWVLDDVQPFFKSENIDMDFSKRGIYSPQKKENKEENGYFRKSLITRKTTPDIVSRCIPEFQRKYKKFVKRNTVFESTSFCIPIFFIHHILLEERKKWYRKQRNEERIKILKEQGVVSYVKGICRKKRTKKSSN